MNAFRRSLLVIFVIVLGACSSHQMAVKYQPSITVDTPEIAGPVSVANVTDSRGEDSTWLATVRGGYGNPLKKLYTEKPVTAVVADAFEDALVARGWHGTTGQSEFRFMIDLIKFHANYFWNKQAYTHFTLNVTHVPTDSQVFSRTYTTDNKRAGAGAGIFADVEALGAFANETLNQTIDKALTDPELVSVLQESRSMANQKMTVEQKLKQIKDLKQEGLITEAEYEKMRSDVLSDF